MDRNDGKMYVRAVKYYSFAIYSNGIMSIIYRKKGNKTNKFISNWIGRWLNGKRKMLLFLLHTWVLQRFLINFYGKWFYED